MRDEGLDQFAARALEGLSAAEVGSVRFNEGRIEVVLADQQAESVAEPSGTGVRTVRAIPAL